MDFLDFTFQNTISKAEITISMKALQSLQEKRSLPMTLQLIETF